MSRFCELTGKGPTTGNNVSHSNIKTRTRWLPNLVRKRFAIPELGQTIYMKLSTEAIRTIDKQGGISTAILQAKEEKLSENLLKVRRALKKKFQNKGSK
jgi:large subunit ribosomal protein L28